jgi:O-antigen/teichoic acid export membrane protein
MFKKIKKITGIDNALFNALLKGCWVAISNVISLILVVNCFNGVERGYYFTFLSLAGMQVFVEMGLLLAISQSVSHEISFIKVISGHEKSLFALSRLRSILNFSTVWFFFGSLLFIIILIPSGYLVMFSSNINLAQIGIYKAAWIFFVILSGIQLMLMPFQAILEGANNVADIALMKLAQSFFASIIFWIFLIYSGSIYSMLVIPCINILIGSFWIVKKYSNFFIRIIETKIDKEIFNWKKDIFPFQWRLAVSWVSGYFIFYLYTPFIFKQIGPEEAGKFGMTMQVLNIISSGVILWISTKMPLFGILVSNNKVGELKLLFKSQFRKSIYVLMFSIILFLMIYFVDYNWGRRYVNSLLDIDEIIILVIALIANHVIFSISYFVRSFKKEPLMLVSVLNGLSSVLLAYILIPKYQAFGATIAYVLSVVVFGFIGSLIVFRKIWNQNQY